MGLLLPLFVVNCFFLNTSASGMRGSLSCERRGQGTCHRPRVVLSRRQRLLMSQKGSSQWTMSPPTFSLVGTCNPDQIGKTVKERHGWPGYISQVDNGLPAACVEHVLKRHKCCLTYYFHCSTLPSMCFHSFLMSYYVITGAL